MVDYNDPIDAFRRATEQPNSAYISYMDEIAVPRLKDRLLFHLSIYLYHKRLKHAVPL